MANEYLQRLPTSTGNTRVFTISCWLKHQFNGSNHLDIFHAYDGSSSNRFQFMMKDSENSLEFWSGGTTGRFAKSTGIGVGNSERSFRDHSGWMHVVGVMNTPAGEESQRCKIYVNGVDQPLIDSPGSGVTGITTNINPNQVNARFIHHIMGVANDASSNAGQAGCRAYMNDFFFVDGQALTPDVFGFYKPGKGYISAGSTQATDFRNGQWVPRKPSSIIQEINDEGGFGVNGFYLPMNDSNNFGADFHCDPNSIITLNEKLSQPRVGVANTASVGLGYTDALRADPYAANLVLALPFVSSGLGTDGTSSGTNRGFGDYSHIIRNSGVAKTITISGSVSIASTASYYGSAASFTGIGGTHILSPDHNDFEFGSGDYTVEFWCNPSRTINYEEIVSKGTPWQLYRSNTGAFLLAASADGTTNYWVNSSIGIGAAGQWHHIAVSKKGSTTYGFLNGVCGLAVTNSSSIYDGTSGLVIGSYDPLFNSYPFQGYIQDLRIYKGVAKYTGGFDVPRPYTPVGIATWRAVPDTCQNNFATLNPLIEARPSSATDSPSNSTLVTFAGGNLDLTNSGSAGNAQRMYSFGTIGISTGRWYWEVRAGSNDVVAISKGFQQKSYGAFLGSGSGIEASVGYLGGGSVSIANTAYYSTATTLTPPTFDTTNIIGIAVSANNGLNNLTVQWFKDGVSVVTLTGVGATSSVLEWFPSRLVNSSGSGGDTKYNFGQNPTFSGNVSVGGTFTDSNGKGLFKYQPPAGFLALCEDNLPKPTIEDPGKYFKTVLYTGDGNSGRSIVGVGFTPDLVWIKSRNATLYHLLTNSVTGVDNTLSTNTTDAESFSTERVLNSFDSDGFSLNADDGSGYYGWNVSGQNYVAWCWRAGGAAVVNTNGTISSQVSANQTAGFSIVSYTGNGVSNATVGHGLGKVPAFGVVKCRDTNSVANDWRAQHKGLTSGYYNVLSSTADQSLISSTSFGSLGTFTSSSTVTLQAGSSDSTTTNENGKRYIMYLWAEIEGFSKFGSYVGNGNADGPFVYCGFKPVWIMIKRTDATNDWVIFDSSRNSTNPANAYLESNTSDIETTDSGAGSRQLDILSNGFKLRDSAAAINASGGTYIFVAFAESPFQTANAK